MKQRPFLADLATHMALGAAAWGGGLALFGIAEMIVNFAVGLYQTPAVWSFVISVYAIAGLLIGLAGGLALGLLQRLRPVLPAPLQLQSAPLLMAAYLGGFLFVFVALPINDRVLPGILDPISLVTNAALFLASFALAALAYRHLDSADHPALRYANLALWFGLLLSAGMYIDSYVAARSSLPYTLGLYAAVLLGAALLHRLVDRGFARTPVAGFASLAAIALLGLFVRQATLAPAGTTPQPGKPNIVWMVLDTVRADHLSAYGYDRDTSPNLSRLAQDGVVFENAVAQSSWTVPSHYQMITSRFEAGKERFLGDRFVTAAEILKEQGYDTGAVLANLSLGRGSGFGQGFDTVIDGPIMVFFHELNDKLPVLKWLRRSGILPADTIVRWFHGHTFQEGVAARGGVLSDHAIQWIQDRKGSPFFLFMNYLDAHDGYDPPEPYRSRFAPNVDPLRGFVRYDPDIDEAIDSNTFVRDKLPDLDDDDWQQIVDLYDGEIAYLDAHLGRVFDALEKAGVYDDTIIVITADHGELFGEHGLAYHFKALTEEETHVPLIIRYPAGMPPGRRIATTVEVNDVLPTLLDLTGVASDVPMDGDSLVQLARDGDSPDGLQNAEAFTYLLREPQKKFPHTHPGHLFSIKRGSAKYVWSSGGHHEYYDLAGDPEAHQNLYADGPAPATEAERLAAWRKQYGLEVVEQEELDRVTRDRLKALGYID